MARTATETAQILMELYDERFGGVECVPYARDKRALLVEVDRNIRECHLSARKAE